MRRLIKLTLIATLIFVSSSAFGQKFGYINSNELISVMPELDSVRVQITKVQEDYAAQLEVIQVEWNNKYQDYQKNAATNSEAINQMKQKELTELSQRYEEYQNLATQEIQKAQSDLMQPIYEKADNAIKKVGQANGYLVVFDQASGPIVYFDEQQVTNILPLVKTELGIKDTVATAN